MKVSRQTKLLMQSPLGFVMRTLKSFRANQGLLLAGAVAYYALLSIVPLLILIVIALSHVVDQAELLHTLEHYLEWLVPGQSGLIEGQLENFLLHRSFIGWFLLVTMIFFSSLAFSVLENAMSIIFFHRIAIRRRHFLVSAVLPYLFILFLGICFLLLTLVAGVLQMLGEENISFMGFSWSMGGVSGVLLYLLGFCGEVFVLSAIYLVMPVGHLSLRHALIGAVPAATLWEIVRHVLVWYFGTLSKVGEVYGSLTAIIIVLFSLEIVAALVLLGAQIISEYECLGKRGRHARLSPLRLG